MSESITIHFRILLFPYINQKGDPHSLEDHLHYWKWVKVSSSYPSRHYPLPWIAWWEGSSSTSGLSPPFKWVKGESSPIQSAPLSLKTWGEWFVHSLVINVKWDALSIWPSYPFLKEVGEDPPPLQAPNCRWKFRKSWKHIGFSYIFLAMGVSWSGIFKERTGGSYVTSISL